MLRPCFLFQDALLTNGLKRKTKKGAGKASHNYFGSQPLTLKS